MRAVNLIPADQRRGAGGLAGRSGGIVYVVAGGLLVIVALGVVYAFSVKSVADRKGQLAQVTQEVSAIQVQTVALEPYVNVARTRQAKVKSVVTLAEGRFNWPAAMRQLALALPSDVTFTSFTGTVGSPADASTAAAPSTSTAGSGPTFQLSGCANSQSEMSTVLSRLQNTPGMTDVRLQTSSKTGKKVPNSRTGTIPRSQALVSGAGCAFVGWTLSATYSPSYTVPNQKLPKGAASGGQTVSTAGPSTTTTSTLSGTVNR
jgi:Tfp pilus assembly protein PilN